MSTRWRQRIEKSFHVGEKSDFSFISGVRVSVSVSSLKCLPYPPCLKQDHASVLNSLLVKRRNDVGGVFTQFCRQVKPHIHTLHERAASQRQE